MIDLRLSLSLQIKLYDSLKAMPAALYQKAKQYEVMAAELGTSVEELNASLARVENYGLAGEKEKFAEQLHNYRLAWALAKDGYEPGQLEWACYIYSVNDVPLTDYSEAALTALIEEWSGDGLTQAAIEETLDEVKKNSAPN